MTHSRGVGGSEAHDLRREGTVTPRDHHPQSADVTGGTGEALADPNRPHKSPSAREERRAAERARRAEERKRGSEASGDADGDAAEVELGDDAEETFGPSDTERPIHEQVKGEAGGSAESQPRH